MSTSYTRFNIQDLPLEENPAGTDLIEVAVATGNGYVTKRETAAAIADAIVNDYEYTQDLNTTSKKITGAINEVMSAKADISSLATVATSGAYSDLTGKPTIDAALDDTSTNAVENRAVASEINSIKSDITVEGSASGDIATFVDGSDNPLKALTISIVAQQSGSGDPSLDNERPISGWTGANIYTRGFNLWDEEWELGIYDLSTGKKVDNASNIRCKNLIPINPAFQLCWYNAASNVIRFAYYDKDRQIISNNATTQTSPYVFTVPSNAKYMSFYYGATTYSGGLCISYYPPTNNEYVAHDTNSETITINWQSTAGTVYGGTLDVKTGVLIVTHLKKLGRESVWQIQESPKQIYYTSSYSSIKKEGSTNIICDSYKISNASSVTDMGDLTIKGRATDGNIYIRDTNYTSLDSFRTAVANVEIMFELKTPVTYQLTPTEIRSLLGLNNVWADCGSITELKYTRDLNLCINDIIARIEALEGGSNSRSLSLSTNLTKSIVSDFDTAESKTEETEEETKEEAQNER